MYTFWREVMYTFIGRGRVKSNVPFFRRGTAMLSKGRVKSNVGRRKPAHTLGVTVLVFFFWGGGGGLCMCRLCTNNK